MATRPNFPQSTPIGPEGKFKNEWVQYLLNPSLQSLSVAGPFGANGQPAQESFPVGAAVSGTAGAAYTGVEQAIINDLVTLVNNLRAALIANGIVEL